jgi:hypothetical protein
MTRSLLQLLPKQQSANSSAWGPECIIRVSLDHMLMREPDIDDRPTGSHPPLPAVAV